MALSNRNVHRIFVSILLACMLNACGGGGGSGEGAPGAGTGSSGLAFPLNVVVANARFLLFPNSQRLVTDSSLIGTDQTNTLAYATAYYAAIDPNGNKRDTLDHFKATNNIAVDGTGEPIDNDNDQVTVVFGDKNDLGYGRRMTARINADGSLAFMVQNYLVNTDSSAGYTYSSLNVDAAVVKSPDRFVSVSAIEYSDLDGPAGFNGPKFVKFYVFGQDGIRKPMVDQDGLGSKAMPNICVNCHGGRADRLTIGNLFPLVGNAASRIAPAVDADSRGDTTSRLQTLKVHTFDFSKLNPAFNRANQEAKMRKINQWVHSTYSSTGSNEWDGSVAQAAIEAAYGGGGFPNATYSDSAAISFVPDANWTTSGQSDLYKNVVGPSCMTCHILRGTKIQKVSIPTSTRGDISFTTFTQFSGYADRIKAHVYDRGNMPLAKIVFDQFWGGGSTMPQTLASIASIAAQGATATLKPGRPIADPGPDRYVRQGTLALTAINSLYASSFNWSLVSNPGNGASFTASTSGTSTSLNFTADGIYIVRLTASGNGLSGTKDITVLVDNAAPDPATLNFTNIQTVFTNAGCTAGGCHSGTLTDAGHPPLSYVAGDYASAAEFLNTVRSRINFTDVVASPLLRKPSGNHHGGGASPLTNFNTSLALGSAGRRNYDFFVEWIMAGTPQ